MSIARSFVPLLTLFGLVILASYSLLLARADSAFRENNLASLRTAVRLVPANAAYHALLAEHLEAAGANPDAELEMATNLSPYESRYWIRRGFRAELEQNFDESERDLLQAYRVDRGFDPRWALMNYYFRRGRLTEFWKSTRDALDISYGDRDPIFRLCLAASDDPAVIRRALPPRRDILFAFFTYLTSRGLVESAASIAGQLALSAQPEDVNVLLEYCGEQIHRNAASALGVWNAMCDRHLIPFASLAPSLGRIVTNGEFTALPLQRGYDWKYGTDPGVAVGPLDAAQGVSIDLGGKQQDGISLIEQEIPLTPGKQYTIQYEYRLAGASGDSGLHWLIQGAANQAAANQGAVAPEIKPEVVPGNESMAVSPVLAARDWRNETLTFSSGRRDSAKLILEYRRTPGNVRWNGTAQIRRVTSVLSAPGSGK